MEKPVVALTRGVELEYSFPASPPVYASFWFRPGTSDWLTNVMLRVYSPSPPLPQVPETDCTRM